MPARRVSPAAVVAVVARLAGARAGRTIFVGVDGCGAAGKSTLAARIAAAVPDAVVVGVDDFSGPRISEWDWARFREQVLLPLLAGQRARYQRWDWDRDRGAEWHEVPPGRVVIVEGVSSTRAEVGAPWSLRVWVEAPRQTRLERALERDGEAMLGRWIGDWMPSEQAYIAAQRPQLRADLVVDGTER